MTLATFLQIIRIAFMLGGSYITAKTGLTIEHVEGVAGPVAAAVGALWSLKAGVQARRDAESK